MQPARILRLTKKELGVRNLRLGFGSNGTSGELKVSAFRTDECSGWGDEAGIAKDEPWTPGHLAFGSLSGPHTTFFGSKAEAKTPLLRLCGGCYM